MNQIKINIIKATSLMVVSALIGGLIYIPFLISSLGYWFGFLYIILGGIISLLLNLMLLEVSLRTEGTQTLIFMFQKYLGNLGKLIASSLIILVGLFYIWLLINTGSNIIKDIFGGNQFIINIIFILVIFIFVYLKTKLNPSIHIFLLSLFVFCLFIVLLKTFVIDNSYLSFPIVHNSVFKINSFYFYLGGILFSYFNCFFIQEAESILVNNKVFIKNVIIISHSIILLLYILVTLIMFFNGGLVSQNFIFDLKNLLPLEIYIILQSIFLGFILLVITYMSQYLNTIYNKEFNTKKNISIILLIFPFLVLNLLGIILETSTITYIGQSFISFLGIMIVLMFWKSKYKGDTVPEFSLGKMKLGGKVIIFILGISMLRLILNKIGI